MSNEDTNKKIGDPEAEEDKSSQKEETIKTEDEKAKINENKDDGKATVNDAKPEGVVNDDATDVHPSAGDGDTEEEEKEELKKPAKKRPVKVNDEVKDEMDEDDDDEEEEEEDEAKDEEMKNGVEDKDSRKKEDKDGKKDEVDIPNGKGTLFSECPRIDFFIKQKEADQLKKLHQVLYGKVGKPDKIKEHLLLFKGFDYEPESDAYIKKKQFIGKLDVKHLKDMCDILDVEKKGKKEEIVNRIMDFLMEPKDSGKPLPPQPTPRPKRTSAVKANNRGYAGLDADDSDDEEGGRGRARATGRRNKSRPSYKDDSSSDEEQKGRKAGGKKYADSDDEAESEPELTPSESDSDSPKKKKGPGGKSKGKAPAKRKIAAKGAKKTPGKKGKKKEESESDGPSESEDEPLQKKSKKPPTDEEIKKYVKQILDGANLEEITMKTVCKQVYGRYPDHDLTHKKDLIKATVKSVFCSKRTINLVGSIQKQEFEFSFVENLVELM